MLSAGLQFIGGAVSSNLILPFTNNLASITPERGSIVYNTGVNPGIYIYNGTTWMDVVPVPDGDPSKIISSNTLPAFTGDVRSVAGSATLLLNDILPDLIGDEATYNSVVVNSKGQIIDGYYYTTLTDMGISDADELLLNKEIIDNKGMPDGYAGLDSDAYLLAENFPGFTGDVVSVPGTNILTLKSLNNASNPLVSITGTYNSVIVNNKGLVIGGTKLDLYTKSEVDFLIGSNVYQLDTQLVNIAGTQTPINYKNSKYAILNNTAAASAKKGDIAVVTAVNTTYVRKQITEDILSDWIELPQRDNGLSGVDITSRLTLDLRLTNTSAGLQIINSANPGRRFSLPAPSTVQTGGPLFIFKNKDITNGFKLFTSTGNFLFDVNSDSTVSVYLAGSTDLDWMFVDHSLKGRELSSNKSANTSLVGTNNVSSDTLYPTQKAVKTYVDNKISDNITSIKGTSITTGGNAPELINAGLATLDKNNLLTIEQLPPQAIAKVYSLPATYDKDGQTYTTSTINYLDALYAYASTNNIEYNIGDTLVIDSLKKTFIVQSVGPVHFLDLPVGVTSVNGRIGAVTIDASDVSTGVFDPSLIPNVTSISSVRNHGPITESLVLTKDSENIQLFSTQTDNLNIKLPAVSSMSAVGVKFIIKNTGFVTEKSIDIKNSANTTLYTLAPNQAVTAILVNKDIDDASSWIVAGYAVPDRFAELDRNKKILAAQLPTFTGDVTSDGTDITIKDAPFYNESYTDEFYGYTKVNRQGLITDVKNRLVTISDINQLPELSDDTFDPDIRYSIADTKLVYTWDGSKYVLVDNLYAAHNYIISTLGADKSHIIKPGSKALLATKGDLVHILSEKKTYYLNSPNSSVLANWVELFANLEGVEFAANKNKIDGYAGLDASGKLDLTQIPAFAYTKVESDAKYADKTLLGDRNTAGGYLGLNLDNKIDSAYLPAITTNNIATVTTIAERDALVASIGDMAIVMGSVNKNYILSATEPNVWTELANPTGGVTSINGNTGVISLTLANISGTLPATALPTFTGDILRANGSAELTIAKLNGIVLDSSFNGTTLPSDGAVFTYSVAGGKATWRPLTINNLSGTLSPTALPALIGDVTSIAGTNNLAINKLNGINLDPAFSDSVLPDDGDVFTFSATGAKATWKPLNASSFTTGTLSINILPAFAGDVSSVAGTNELVISKINGIALDTEFNKDNLPIDGSILTYSSSTSKIAWKAFDASIMVTGTLGIGRLPAFTGDVTSTLGTNTLTLSNTGVVAGTYNSVTVDAKGRVTAGSSFETYSKTEADAKYLLKTALGNRDEAGGYVGLNNAKKIDPSFLPAITLNTSYSVTTLEERDALTTTNIGDIAIVTGDINATYILSNASPKTWTLLSNPLSAGSGFNPDSFVLADIKGNLSAEALPAFTGDVTSVAGTNILTLSNTNAIAGTYNNDASAITPFTVDTKGRIVSVGSPVTIKPHFTDIIGMPASLADFGIGDLYTKAQIDTLITNKLEKNADIVAGSGFKITYDTKGLITGSSDLLLADIPALPADKITSGIIDINRLPANLVFKDESGSIPSSLIPSVSLTSTVTPATTADMTSSTASTGTLAIITNDPDPTKNGSYIKADDGSWKQLSVPTGTVASINGKSGNIEKILPEDIAGLFADDLNKTLLTSKLPLFDGDIVSTANNRNILTLKDIPTITENISYTSVKVNSKGIVIGGIIGDNYNKADIDDKFVTKLSLGEKNAIGGYVSLNLSNAIPAEHLPIFDGDVVSTSFARNTLTLKDMPGLVEGASYSSITVNKKGLVIGGSIGTNYSKEEIDTKFLSKSIAGDRNAPDGFAGLNSDGKIDSAYLPSITLNNIKSVTTIAARDALVAKIGDIAIVSGNINKTYILSSLTPKIWNEMLSPTGGVTSVNGNIGAVTLDLSNLPGNLAMENAPVYTTGDVITNVDTHELSLNTIDGLAAGTYSKVTVNNKGLVIAATQLTLADIPDLSWDKIKLNKPTTLAEFGITDVVSASDVRLTDSRTPLAHTHAIADIIDLRSELDSKMIGNPTIIAKTGFKISYDAKGLVTSSSELTLADIPELSADKITSGLIDVNRLPTNVVLMDSNGNLPSNLIPTVSLTGTITVASYAAMIGSTSSAVGTAAIVTSDPDPSKNGTYIKAAGNIWRTLVTPTNTVLSINSKFGHIGKITPDDISGVFADDANKTILPSKLPDFDGDVISSTSSKNTLLLKEIPGLSENVSYSSVRVNSKGLVISGIVGDNYTKTEIDSKFIPKTALGERNIAGGYAGLNPSNTIDADQLPAFEGDVISSASHKNVLTLKEVPGLIENINYASVKVNSKGIVIGGIVGENYTKDEIDSKFLLKSVSGDKNAAGGFVGLNSSLKIDPAYLPAITLNSIKAVTTIAERDLLSVRVGDVAIVAGSVNKTFILADTSPKTWIEMLNPVGGVASVNGNTGAVVLDLSNLSGTLSIDKLPAFTTGDVITNSTTKELELKTIGGLIAGTYSKVTINNKGLVTNASQLSASDIPDLSWDKIINKPTTLAEFGVGDVVLTTDVRLNNAREPLAHTHTISNILGLQDTLDNVLSKNIDITPNTATKVTYDNKGLITGSESLAAADIPNLDISKITGLQDTLTLLQTSSSTGLAKNADIVAGVGTKISYDIKGLVTGSSNLTATDIPTLPINKISGLQLAFDDKVTKNANIPAGSGFKITYDAKGLVTGSSNLTSLDIPLLSINQVDGLQASLDTKLTKPSQITAGSGTKITFNADGLVTSGTAMTDADLPNLAISKITGLQSALDNKLTKNVNVIAGTGVKITYDAKGLVTGSSILTSTDIPTLPSTKISGLQNILDSVMYANVPITSGTAAKITYDEKGLVTAGTSLIASDIPDLNISQITGLQDALSGGATADLLNTAIDALKDNVAAEGDTLKKLYDLIVASFKEITVADTAARDAFDVKTLPTNLFVSDDGDGHWALYKATSTGIGATFIKLSDPDLLNSSIGFNPENVINKSADTTLGGLTPDDIKYPTQKAVKAYVDTTITTSNIDVNQLPTSVVLLDGTGKIPNSLLPPVSLTGSTITPASYTAMVATTATTGTLAIVTADSDPTKNGSYIKLADGSWQKLSVTSSSVNSINGKTGNITKILPEDIAGVFADDANKTLLSSKLPIFDGDVISTTGARSTLTLKEIESITENVAYSSVILNKKGLVIGGTIGASTDAYTKVESDGKYVTILALGSKNTNNGYAGLSATGLLDNSVLPVFDGDVISTTNAKTTLTLKDIETITENVAYSSVILNKKGLVVGGTIGASTDAYTKVESDGKYVLKTVVGVRNTSGGFAGLDANGVLNNEQLPLFDGDVINSSESRNILVLKDMVGLATGTSFTSVTVNSKGLVIGGTIGEVYTRADAEAAFISKIEAGDKNAPSGYLGLNSSGKIEANFLPLFTGDVVSSANARNVLTLPEIDGLVEGIKYSSITVNKKGLVVGGTRGEVYSKDEADLAFASKLVLGDRNAADGFIGLNSNGKIDPAYLPAITLNSVQTVTTIAERDALSVRVGDVAIVVGNINKTFILSSIDPITWIEMVNPLGGVTSVNGNTGDINLSLSNLPGVISHEKLPAYTSGDVITNTTTNNLELATINGLVAGSYSKVTINEKGLVTATSQLTLADIPNLSWDKITLNKPTTLAEFGIIDVVSSNDPRFTDARAPLAHTHIIDDITGLQSALDGKLIGNTAIVAGTGFKISYDAKGLVTSSSDLTLADIPELSASKITTGVIDVNRLPTNVVLTDANGNLPSNLIPAISLTNTITPASYAAMSSATATTGTLAIVTDDADLTKNGSYIKLADGSWKKMTVPSNTVASINGKTGNIEKILPEDIAGVFDIDANKTLLSSKLPIFDGDVISTTESRNTLTLKEISGLTENVAYSSVILNKKGLVIGGIVGENYTKAESDAKYLAKNDLTGDFVTSINGKKGTITKIEADDIAGVFNSDSNKTLLVSKLPIFDGDVISTTDSRNTLTLKEISGLTANVSYSSVILNKKGLVVGGIVGENYSKSETNDKFLSLAISGNRNAPSGFVGLNTAGKIEPSYLPAITLNNIKTVTTLEDRDALFVALNDVVIVSSLSKTFILTSNTPKTWNELLSPAGGVSSVNGNTGAVTVDLSNIPGTLPLDKLPTYTLGDVITNTTTKELELKTLSNLTPGQYTKVSVNNKGLIVSASQLTATDIPNISWNKITLDKPTTLAGFGIAEQYATLINNKIPYDLLNRDVIEGDALPAIGEANKIYVNKTTNTTHRWDGAAFVQIGGGGGSANNLTGVLNLSLIPDLSINKITGLQTALDGKLSKNAAISAGTGIKVTYDTNGLIVSSSGLLASDIPDLNASKITAGIIDINRLPTNIVLTDESGKLPASLIPSVTLTNTVTPATTADMTSSTADTGTLAIITNDPDPTKNGSYIKMDDGSWTQVTTPTDTVASINGKTGIISKILPEDIAGVFEPDANKTLLTSKLPLFDGDVVSTTNSRNTLTLKEISGLIDNATYTSIRVNKKGLVIGGTIGEVYSKTDTDAKFVTNISLGSKNTAGGYAGLSVNGTIELNQLPIFNGDVISTANARGTLSLKEIGGLTENVNYSSVRINKKGLVIGGTIGENYSKTDTDAKFVTKLSLGSKNTAGGYVGLNLNSKIDLTYLPSMTTNNVIPVATLDDRDALSANIGDVAIVAAVNKTFILADTAPMTWMEMLNPTGGVTSVNGNMGAVTIDLSNIPGTLSASKLPAYTTGDVITNTETGELVLSPITGLTAGAYAKVVINEKGLVIGSSALTAADIPDLSWDKITTGKPSTAADFGLTDIISTSRLPIDDNGIDKLVTVGSDGKINSLLLPSLAISDTYTFFASTATKDDIIAVGSSALNAQQGDIAIVGGDAKATYILTSNTPNILTDWVQLQTPEGGVISINGQKGTLILDYAAIDNASTNIVTAGSYNKVTVNTKGRITAVNNESYAVLTNNLLAAANIPSFSGDITNTAGSVNLILTNTGVTAGTYNSVTVDSKGRVVAGTTELMLTNTGVVPGVYNKVTVDAQGRITAGTTELTLDETGVVPGTYNTVTVDATGRITAGLSEPTLSDTGVEPGSYTSVMVDAKGRVVTGSNPSTLIEYGITDALTAVDTTWGMFTQAVLPEETLGNLVMGGGVSSVNGHIGAVNLNKSDIDLDNIDNTSDLAKPVSIPQQAALNIKQDLLVSGTNIKTINGQSILGDGDITISGGSGGGSYVDPITGEINGLDFGVLINKPTSLSGYGILDAAPLSHVANTNLHLTTAQKTLLSGLTVSATELNYTSGLNASITSLLNAKQSTLVSGTNIKTINGTSIVGVGDVFISGGLQATPIKTSSYTANSNDLIRINAVGLPVIITLPANPADGARIGVIDISNLFASNPVSVVATGSKTIEDETSILLDINGTYVTFTYILATQNWKLLELPVNVMSTDVTVVNQNTGPFTTVNGLSGEVTISRVTLDINNVDNIKQLPYAQAIQVSGDVVSDSTLLNSGSLVLTLSDSGVSAGTYNTSNNSIRPITIDSKGRITSVGDAVELQPNFEAITNKPYTLAGYGIVDGDISYKLKTATTEVDISLAAAPTVDQTLVATSATSAVWMDRARNIIPTDIKTANYVASSYDLVIADSSVSSFNITLPASPNNGTIVGVIDLMRTFASHPVTILPGNGADVEDDTSVILDVNNTYITFIYISAATTWRIQNIPVSYEGSGVVSAIDGGGA